MLFLGSLLGFLGVAAGAFGAHGLESRLSEEAMNAYLIGVRYHLVHALALVSVGLLDGQCRAARVAGFAFVSGILLFSGSLYALAISGAKWLGAITPFGGVAFLVGWAALAAIGWSRARRS